MKRIRSLLPRGKQVLISPDYYSMSVVIGYGALVGFGGHFIFLWLFAWLGITTMAYVNIVSCAIFPLCYFLNRSGRSHLALLIGAGEVVIHAILATLYIGWAASFHYYILGLVPLIFYSRVWRTSFKASIVAILAAVYIALYLSTYQAAPFHKLDWVHQNLVSTVNIVTLFIVFSILAHFYISAAAYAESGLRQANQKLESLAHTDPLTRLLNRRSMMNNIAVQINSFSQAKKPFSVIIGDIDDFKKYNDRFGHEAGDQVLVKVADILRKYVREMDYVSRWGGEEFLVLLPNTGQEHGSLIAERLREGIASAKIKIGETEYQITMTFGLATYSGYTEATDCIRRADLAMYQGKRQGKNCVIVHP